MSSSTLRRVDFLVKRAADAIAAAITAAEGDSYRHATVKPRCPLGVPVITKADVRREYLGTVVKAKTKSQASNEAAFKALDRALDQLEGRGLIEQTTKGSLTEITVGAVTGKGSEKLRDAVDRSQRVCREAQKLGTGSRH